MLGSERRSQGDRLLLFLRIKTLSLLVSSGCRPRVPRPHWGEQQFARVRPTQDAVQSRDLVGISATGSH